PRFHDDGAGLCRAAIGDAFPVAGEALAAYRLLGHRWRRGVSGAGKPDGANCEPDSQAGPLLPKAAPGPHGFLQSGEAGRLKGCAEAVRETTYGRAECQSVIMQPTRTCKTSNGPHRR